MLVLAAQTTQKYAALCSSGRSYNIPWCRQLKSVEKSCRVRIISNSTKESECCSMSASLLVFGSGCCLAA